MGIRPPPRQRVDKIEEHLTPLGDLMAKTVRSLGQQTPFVEPVTLVKITPKRREPEPELVMILPRDPYRGRITFVVRVKRPRTWRGRLRSMRRRLRLWFGGRWRTRFERCSVCRRRHHVGMEPYLPHVSSCCVREKPYDIDRLRLETQAQSWEVVRRFFERYRL